MASRGLFIAIEGLDRSGKSTQSALLVQHLREQGHSVEHLRFPDRSTATGQIINAYLSSNTTTTETETLSDQAIHLLFSANRWEAAARIQRVISQGTTIVVDRYYYSGCVYSAAKGTAGMDLAWCRAPEVGLPRPDAWVFFDVDPAETERRGGFGGERYEKREMQERARGLYAEMMGGREEREDVVVVDAGRAVEVVQREVVEVVERLRRKVEERKGELRTIGAW